jgi:hypothetical protein
MNLGIKTASRRTAIAAAYAGVIVPIPVKYLQL